MKRIMNQKLVMIFGAIAVVMAVVFVVLGIFVTNSAKGQFAQDGYILGEVYAEEGDSSNNIYFNANSKYKSKYPNKISLKGEKGKSTISKYSFVHYSNNDLSSFSKGVFVNLDELSNENLNYYNIPAEVLVKSSGKTYSFKVSNKEQRMSNFLWKIEKNKYMVVGTGVTAHIAEGKDKKLEGYVEFEYKDEGVVQLTHRDGTYQTISSDASIILDNGAIIMLNDRSIYLGEDKKLSLDQMVINANDNIDVDEEEEDKTTTNNTTNNSSSTTISGGGSSGGGGTTPTEEINFPEFAVTSMDVGLVSVSAQIEITDDDDLLSEDGVTVAIYERGTSKKVWEKTVQKGQYQISINTDGLNPDSEYILSANSDYEFKGEKYNKDFVSQLFRTNATGIRMTKSNVDSTSIDVDITVKEYSEITTGTLEVINNETGNIEREEKINLAEIKDNPTKGEISISNLLSNTDYSIVLTDLYTGASVLTDENNIEKKIKTLKTPPVLGLPEVTLNKTGKAFSLYLKKEGGDPVVDEDDGINKMVFEIYEATQVVAGQPNGDPVYSAESKKTSGVSVKLDDTNLKRNVKYVYRVIAIFDDNEKIVEYNTTFSSVFTMTSAEYPSIIFTAKDITTPEGVKKEGIEHDSFRGVVEIVDNAGVVQRPNIISYSITGNDGGDVQVKQWDVSSDGELTTPIEVTGLRSNTTYTVTFMGMADLDDGNDPMKIYLGSFQVTTKEKPDPVKAEVKALATTAPSFTKYAFNANIYMGDTYTSTGETEVNPAFEMSTMNSVQLVMYEGIDDGHGNITKGNEWARKNITNSATGVDPINYTYNSTLRGLFSKSAETPYEINPSTFGMTNAQVTSDTYVLEIRNGEDYTYFSNDIEIIGDDNKVAEFIIQKHGFVPNLPANINDSINVTEVLFGDMQEDAGKAKYKEIAKSGAADASLGLKSDTIVGYSVKALSYPSNALKYAKKVTYKMYKLTNYVSQSQVDLSTAELVASTTKTVSSDASSLPAWEVPIKAGTDTSRGNLYVFTYEVELDLAESGEPIKAYYPKDAVGATSSTVLRSVICPCPKESPNMYMYLKNSTFASNKYNMTFRYKYVDTDNAYIIDPDNTSSDQNKFRITNGSASQYYAWNEDSTDGSGTKNISLTGISGGTNSLSILKKVSHYDPITNYSGSITEEEYTVQPMSFTNNKETDIQKLKFHTATDVSNLQIALDSDKDSAAQLPKIAAVKVTLQCDGQTKVFDYLTLDDNNTAFIPLVRIAEFKKKEITVSVTVYYENDELGTDLANRSGSAYPVVLQEYSRNGGYQYINETLKDSLYLVDKDYGDVVLSGTLSAMKFFNAKKLKNVDAETGYTGDEEEEFRYTVDSQGLDTNLTGNNYKIDSYYITRRVDTTSLAPVTDGADKITFSYIRPVAKNASVEPGVTDAKITFDFVGTGKSTLKDNKLYLVVSDSQSTLDVTDPNKTYEIQLGSSLDQKNVSVTVGSGTGHSALVKGKNYYYTIYGKFEDDSSVDTLRLLTIDGEEFIGDFTTLGNVGFSAISYAYSATSYEKKNLVFAYTLKVVTGFYINYELIDLDTKQTINLGEYATTTDIMPKMTLSLPVGNSSTKGIYEQLVYGHKYKLTASAYTSSSGESVGSASREFTLSELTDPTITATMSAKWMTVSSNKRDVIYSTLVIRDSKFAIKDGKVKIKYYAGRVTENTTADPIKTVELDIINAYTYKGLYLGYDSTDPKYTKEPILQPNTEYTMLVEVEVDNDYTGTNIKTMKSLFYAKTLNESGIGYSDIFAKSNEGGSVIVEFYDVEGFTNVNSMDYTIFANTATGVEPITGSVAKDGFVPFGVANVSRRVTINAGLKTQDRYTIVMQLLNGSGKVLAQESRSFSY